MTATVADVLRSDARWCVVEGDSAEVLRTLSAGCVNALVTDPPSGIHFMGAEWDKHKGGRTQWVAWLAGVLAAARTAMVDGSRAFVWSLPRTSHWTGCAVEDAGFAIETTVQHLFATGWPKGASQLKPAAETWWLARTGRSTDLSIEACRVGNAAITSLRPKADRSGKVYGTFAGAPPATNTGRYPPNVVLSHAEGCVCAGSKSVRGNNPFGQAYEASGGVLNTRRDRPRETPPHTHHGSTETVDAWQCVEGCAVAELAAQSGDSASSDRPRNNTTMGFGGNAQGFTAAGHADRGTAARFYPQFPADDPDAPFNAPLFRYEAKPSPAEKEAGVTVEAREVSRYGEMGQGPLPQQTPRAPRDVRNNHPTVKPVALMRWLIRLVTKPGDVVLDPFGGSGTTGVAALLEGRRVILVEQDPRFAAIARARCEHAKPSAARLTRDVAAPIAVASADFGPLFGSTP